MPLVPTDAAMPSTSITDLRPLPEIEHELGALFGPARRPRNRPVGDEVDAVLTRMGELQAAIAAAPARDIADAPVKLRRLGWPRLMLLGPVGEGVGSILR